MLLYILVLVFIATFVANLKFAWANDSDVCKAYVYPGTEHVDIKIVAILGIHEPNKDKCNNSYNTGALQDAIALNWAVHLLNGNNETGSFIPDVQIGIDVYDDCSTEYMAASHAGMLASYFRGNIGCPAIPETAQEIPIAAVIGTSISRTTTVIADILKQTHLPVIGPAATVSELSDKIKYPNFIRVIPSDLKQAKVIISLAKQLSWSYIVGISTSDNYGIEGISELKKLADNEFICMSIITKFDLFTDLEKETFVRTTLAEKFTTTKDKLGIVYFGLHSSLLSFLKYVDQVRVYWTPQDNDLLKKLYWVASDGVEATKELAQIISQYNTNIFIVSPFLVNMSSFKDYFIEVIKHPPAWIRGPWELALINVVKNNLGCRNYNLTSQSLAACNIDQNLVFDSYIPAFLDAIYILTNTLKNIQREVCSEKGETGVCDAFKLNLSNGLLRYHEILDLNYSVINQTYLPKEFSISQRKLQNVSGDFEVTDQPWYSLQAISKNIFIKAADCKEDIINMSTQFVNTFSSSQCNSTCAECLYFEDISYQFYPGDVIFLGIFSMHWQSYKDPYKCGAYREKSKSYIAMEAFINSIDYLNNTTDVNFGYLIINDCYNVLTLTRLLNGILSGDITIPNVNGGKAFNTSQVVVAIGAQSSHATMAALPILTELNIPMISYSATNPKLDNRILYPYFSRTVHSDTVQARVFVDIFKKLDVTFVGAVVIQNTYGLDLYKLFRSLAESEKICVDDAKMVTEYTGMNDYKSFLTYYKSKKIQVIVIIAMDKIVSSFLTAVNADDIFVFIGSEAWGPNLDILDKDIGKRARGALVLGTAGIQLNNGLRNHLQSLNAFRNKSTAWLWDYWQDQFKCDKPGGFQNTHGNKLCDNLTLAHLNSILDELMKSPLVVHSSIATMSAGLAVSSLIKSNTLMPFNPKDFINSLHLVKLMISTMEIKPFLTSGNGDFGFEIYNIQPIENTKDQFIYVNVGNYRSSTGLSLNKSLIQFYDYAGQVIHNVESSCYSGGQQCKAVCTGPQTSSNPETVTLDTTDKQGGINSSSDTVVIILAVFLGLCILIIIILIILGFLSVTGRIHVAQIFPFLNTNKAMSSRSLLSKRQDTGYNSTHDSSFSDIPPQLPTRSNINNQIFHINKAFSDIVSPNHIVPAENVPGRDRANSLPELSHHSIAQNKIVKPANTKLIHKPEQHIAAGHRVPQASAHEPQFLSQPRQLRFSQKGLPVVLPSDAEDIGQTTQNTGDNISYHGSYRNTKSHKDPSPIQQETIIFHNVPFDDAIYRQTAACVNNQPAFTNVNRPEVEYIPVKTQQGVVYMRSSDLLLLINSNSFQNHPTQGYLKNHEQTTVHGVTDPVLLHNSPLQGSKGLSASRSEGYVTPIDVVYTSEYPTGNGLSSENAAQGYADKPIPAVVSQTETFSSHNAHRFPPKGHAVSAITVDSRNYLQPQYYVKTIPAEFMLNTQGHLMRPSLVEDLEPTISVNQPILRSMKQQGLRNVVGPDDPVAPVYVLTKEENPHLFSQAQTVSQEGLHKVPHSPDTDSKHSKHIFPEAQVDVHNTPAMLPEEQLKRQRVHHSPLHITLSQLDEESEEMV